MKIKILVLAIGLFIQVSMAPMQMTLNGQQEKEKAKSRAPSLLRLDLLFGERPPMAPPIRNIFSPNRSGSRSGLPGNYEFEPGLNESEPGAEGEEAMENYVVPLELRYIGYIWSEKKAVALIIFQGETMAVKAGEVIADDVKIIKITPAQIEFIGPDSETKMVSLEGEER